jgi:hypothetical protein
MPIKSTRYVEITSAVAGASRVPQRELIGLRFTTDQRVPVGAQIEVVSGGADDYFGSSSPEADFAREYFGYVSPAPATRPRALLFAAYAPTGRKPKIYGSTTVSALTALQAITAGTLSIQLGAAPANLTGVNLSAALSYAAVATAIQTALQAVGGAQYAAATVTYNAVDGIFEIEGDTVANAAVVVTSAGGPNDLAPLLGLTQVGRILSPGVLAQTPLDAFKAAEQVSDSFGTSSGITALLADATPLAEYIAGENVKYQHYWSVDASTAATWSAALIGTASNGLILNLTAGEYKEALPQAIAASVNYNRRNAVVNFMFRSPQITYTADVTSDLGANLYDPLRVNYYGQTAMYGQNISFFQRGYLCGPATAPLDMGVHLNEQWLKSLLASNFLNLLLVKGIVPASQQGRAEGLILINEAAEQAKVNGTIIAGKTLTATQKIDIESISGDPLAFHQVVNNGYWADAQIIRVTGPSDLAEFVLQYTLIYSANEGVRKVEGSHNLII